MRLIYKDTYLITWRSNLTGKIEQIMTDDITEPQRRGAANIIELAWHYIFGTIGTYNMKLITSCGAKSVQENGSYKEVISLAQASLEEEYYLVTGYKKNGNSKTFMTNKDDVKTIMTALKMKKFNRAYVVNKVSYWGISVVDEKCESESV